MLNPVFSTAHLRNMTPLCNEVCRKLKAGIYQRMGKDPVEIDMSAWMGRTALELIGQAGLGHSFDPLVADSPDEFARLVKSLTYVYLPTDTSDD